MSFTTADQSRLFAELAALMAVERDALCALDGVIGDADHGLAMEAGMAAAAGALAAPPATLQEGFNAAAKAFLNAVGASSGPLYATALLRAGKAAGPRPEMPADEMRAVIAAMAEGIAQRGKAEPGQKTMLDAWAPAAVAASSGAPPEAVAAAARAGAAATAQMIATLGRAARLGERSLGHPDPGATSAALVVGCLCAAWARAAGAAA